MLEHSSGHLCYLVAPTSRYVAWTLATPLPRLPPPPPPPNTRVTATLLCSHPAVFLNEKTLRSSHFWVCLLLTILVCAHYPTSLAPAAKSELPSTTITMPHFPSQGWIAGVIYGIYEIWFSHSNGTARKPKAADVHHGEQRPVV